MVEIILLALAIIIGVAGFLVLIGSIFYFKKDWFKKFYHDILGWHFPDDTLSFNGCSFCSTCKHCGKRIMMDGQGDWF